MLTDTIQRNYDCVTTKRQLQALVRRMEHATSICVDTETTGLDVQTAALVGIAVAFQEHHGIAACYIPVAHRPEYGRTLPLADALDALRPILTRKPTIWHNALFDLAILRRYDVRPGNVHDTMYMAYALYADTLPSLSMDHLASRFLDHQTISFQSVVTAIPGRTTFADVPIQEATQYAAEDVDVTLRLAKLFQRQLKDQGLWEVYTRDRKLIPVLLDMNICGVAVDQDRVRELARAWDERLKELLARLHDMAGTAFNPSSTKQVYDVLAARGVVLEPDRKTGKITADRQTLERHNDDELVKELLAWRALNKLRSTYTDSLLEKVSPITNRVHASFSFTRTATGRAASFGPNLQNIPTRTLEGNQLRGCFVAGRPTFRLASADYSQIEYRILAHISGDRYLLGCYQEGIDLHAKMAADVKGGDWRDFANKADKERYALRTAFKNVNFATIYGAGPAKIAQMSGVDLATAYEILDTHRDMCPRVYDWKEQVLDFARDHGFVSTLFDRRIHTPHIVSRQLDRRGHAERLAVNGVIQGTAADLMRLALVDVHSRFEVFAKPSDSRCYARILSYARILMTVHDEIVVEFDAKVQDQVVDMLKTGMETCADHLVDWDVPIVAEVGVGKTWREAKEN